MSDMGTFRIDMEIENAARPGERRELRSVLVEDRGGHSSGVTPCAARRLPHGESVAPRRLRAEPLPAADRRQTLTGACQHGLELPVGAGKQIQKMPVPLPGCSFVADRRFEVGAQQRHARPGDDDRQAVHRRCAAERRSGPGAVERPTNDAERGDRIVKDQKRVREKDRVTGI